MDNIFKNHFFINLDKRKDRNKNVRKQLKSLGLTKQNRVSAVSRKNGLLGCGLSHIKVIEMAKEYKMPYVCVFEDDLLILDIKRMKEEVKKQLDDPYWDVLMLSGNNFGGKKKEGYIKVSKCYTTGAYIIREHYYDTWLENLKESTDLLKNNPDKKNEYALDSFNHKLQSKHEWRLINPPVATQLPNFSDIENKETDYTPLMLNPNKDFSTNAN